MNSNGNNIGFFGAMGLLFIGLKLAHFIDWTWWWVLLPLYGPFALAILVLSVLAVIHVLKR